MLIKESVLPERSVWGFVGWKASCFEYMGNQHRKNNDLGLDSISRAEFLLIKAQKGRDHVKPRCSILAEARAFQVIDLESE